MCYCDGGYNVMEREDAYLHQTKQSVLFGSAC